MILTPQLKVNELARDFGTDPGILTDILTRKGYKGIKSQSKLEKVQFDILLEELTRENQIENIRDYIDGKTYIPSEALPKKQVEGRAPKKPPTPKKTDEKKAEPKKQVEEEQKKPEPEVRERPAASAPKKQAESREGVRPAEVKTPRRPEPAATVRPFDRQIQRRPAEAAPRRYETTDKTGKEPPVKDPAKDPVVKRAGMTGFMATNLTKMERERGVVRKPEPARPSPRDQGRPQRKPDRDRSAQPKNTFRAQVIVRDQTGKKPESGKRIIDTRGSSVDLSKYDEKLDNFVPESVRDMRGGNVKVKKKGKAPSAAFGKRGAKKKQIVKQQPLKISVPDEIKVAELASRLKATAGEVIKRIAEMGKMVSINEYIDYDTAFLIADEMGAEVTREVVVTIEEKLFDETKDAEEKLEPRAPVVCVMGHVDHGKTSLLDAIRHTNVTSGEAGGITQHIGAYRVKIGGKDITFLDTPGHEAFTAMRARGAQATDIAVLVVAADDGVMPQTVEAINHAKAAGVDIVVAINKMDKPAANAENIMRELAKYDLIPEEWGGDTICVPVSALTGFGIEKLLESVLLVAEVKELKANPARRAKGIVIEARLDKGRGPVATVLVQNGTLNRGDVVIAGTAVGRVRAMNDHNGKNLKSAAPSVPVEITGLSEVPTAGDEFNAVEDEKMARMLADRRRNKAKEEEFKENKRANLNDLFEQISQGVKNLNIIVKADVDGSVEAVKTSLEKISNDEVQVKVMHAAAGGINEGDVMLAAVSNAIIVGFNVRPDKTALDQAERRGVDIRTYRVIYNCIEEITAAMKGMLAPKYKEVLQGHVEVRQTIHVPNVGTIAGSYVQDGKVTRTSSVRILRQGIVVFEDKILSLRRFKDDVREVAAGFECGIGLERFNDLKEGDIFEIYVMEEIER